MAIGRAQLSHFGDSINAQDLVLGYLAQALLQNLSLHKDTKLGTSTLPGVNSNSGNRAGSRLDGTSGMVPR